MLAGLSVEMGDDGTIKLTSDRMIVDPADHFQGLTLYVEPGITPIVTYGLRQLSFVHNGPDESGRYSISIPIKKTVDIWH